MQNLKFLCKISQFFHIYASQIQSAIKSGKQKSNYYVHIRVFSHVTCSNYGNIYLAQIHDVEEIAGIAGVENEN